LYEYTKALCFLWEMVQKRNHPTELCSPDSASLELGLGLNFELVASLL